MTVPSCGHEKLKSLQPIPFYEGVVLERTMGAWSVIMALWLVLGVLWMIRDAQGLHETSRAISRIGVNSYSIADAFQKLEYYLYVDLFASLIVWLCSFKLRAKLAKRDLRGAKILFLPIYVLFFSDIAGILLSSYVGAEVSHAGGTTRGLEFLQFMRWVRLLVILTSLPLLGKYAPLYCEYVSIDREVFRRQGAAWNFLKPNEIEERKKKILARKSRSLKALILYAVSVLVLLAVSLVSNNDGLLIAVLCLAGVSTIWLIVESTFLAPLMYFSRLGIALGGYITGGMISALFVAYFLAKSRRELSSAPK